MHRQIIERNQALLQRNEADFGTFFSKMQLHVRARKRRQVTATRCLSWMERARKLKSMERSYISQLELSIDRLRRSIPELSSRHVSPAKPTSHATDGTCEESKEPSGASACVAVNSDKSSCTDDIPMTAGNDNNTVTLPKENDTSSPLPTSSSVHAVHPCARAIDEWDTRRVALRGLGQEILMRLRARLANKNNNHKRTKHTQHGSSLRNGPVRGAISSLPGLSSQIRALQHQVRPLQRAALRWLAEQKVSREVQCRDVLGGVKSNRPQSLPGTPQTHGRKSSAGALRRDNRKHNRQQRLTHRPQYNQPRRRKVLSSAGRVGMSSSGRVGMENCNPKTRRRTKTAHGSVRSTSVKQGGAPVNRNPHKLHTFRGGEQAPDGVLSPIMSPKGVVLPHIGANTSPTNAAACIAKRPSSCVALPSVRRTHYRTPSQPLTRLQFTPSSKMACAHTRRVQTARTRRPIDSPSCTHTVDQRTSQFADIDATVCRVLQQKHTPPLHADTPQTASPLINASPLQLTDAAGELSPVGENNNIVAPSRRQTQWRRLVPWGKLEPLSQAFPDMMAQWIGFMDMQSSVQAQDDAFVTDGKPSDKAACAATAECLCEGRLAGVRPLSSADKPVPTRDPGKCGPHPHSSEVKSPSSHSNTPASHTACSMSKTCVCRSVYERFKVLYREYRSFQRRHTGVRFESHTQPQNTHSQHSRHSSGAFCLPVDRVGFFQRLNEAFPQISEVCQDVNSVWDSMSRKFWSATTRHTRKRTQARDAHANLVAWVRNSVNQLQGWAVQRQHEQRVEKEMKRVASEGRKLKKRLKALRETHELYMAEEQERMRKHAEQVAGDQARRDQRDQQRRARIREDLARYQSEKDVQKALEMDKALQAQERAMAQRKKRAVVNERRVLFRQEQLAKKQELWARRAQQMQAQIEARQDRLRALRASVSYLYEGVEVDKERTAQATESSSQRKMRTDGEKNAAFYRQDGFSDERLMQDSSTRLMFRLRQAGLHDTAYGSYMLNSVLASKPVPKAQLSSIRLR